MGRVETEEAEEDGVPDIFSLSSSVLHPAPGYPRPTHYLFFF